MLSQIKSAISLGESLVKSYSKTSTVPPDFCKSGKTLLVKKYIQGTSSGTVPYTGALCLAQYNTAKQEQECILCLHS